MHWVREYASITMGTDLDCKGDVVVKRLKAVGYMSDEHINELFVEGNKEVMGRYIIGQVMASLEKGQPPRPVATSFVDQYTAMPNNAVKRKKMGLKPSGQ